MIDAKSVQIFFEHPLFGGMLKKILQYWCRQVSQKQLKKSFIIGPMSHYFPALYKFDSVVLLRLDRCDLRGLEDANLEHLSTLKRVKILKMLESLTAVERYRMLWQLLLTVESCDSFYELWQLLSDVRSGGFNKLWNLRQTLVCRLTDKAKQSYWT